MALTIFLDRRVTVNGKKSTINLDNYLNLNKFIQDITNSLIANIPSNNTNTVTVFDDSASATTTDQYIQVSGTAAPVSITLPDASTVTGKEFIIQANDITGDVTIDTDGGNINGTPSVILTAQYDYVRVISDGTDYFIIGSLITTP